MRITRLPGALAVARAGAGAAIPPGILDGPGLRAVTRTDEELSIVAPEGALAGMDRVEPGWAAFMVEGPLDFGEIGILAALSRSLAGAEIGIFVISTFDTDYILVKAEDAEAAAAAWRTDGHAVRSAPD